MNQTPTNPAREEETVEKQIPVKQLTEAQIKDLNELYSDAGVDLPESQGK